MTLVHSASFTPLDALALKSLNGHIVDGLARVPSRRVVPNGTKRALTSSTVLEGDWQVDKVVGVVRRCGYNHIAVR